MNLSRGHGAAEGRRLCIDQRHIIAVHIYRFTGRAHSQLYVECIGLLGDDLKVRSRVLLESALIHRYRVPAWRQFNEIEYSRSVGRRLILPTRFLVR